MGGMGDPYEGGGERAEGVPDKEIGGAERRGTGQKQRGVGDRKSGRSIRGRDVQGLAAGDVRSWERGVTGLEEWPRKRARKVGDGVE